ncbi:MAG: protein kinase [Rhodoferax sp.]|nr:protein kinase [Rhodoferax sp.]
MTEDVNQIAQLQEHVRKLEKIVALERKLREQLSQRIASAAPASNSPSPTDKTEYLATEVMAAPLHEPAPKPGAPEDPDATQISESTAIAMHAHEGSTEPLPNGYMLGEYRIDRVLGRGGFGVTYLATDVNLNVQVALKEYFPQQFAHRMQDGKLEPLRRAEDAQLYHAWLDGFLEEARTLASFRHPNIVRVARFFEANATAYMVLDYERGTCLKDWWPQNKNLSESELVALLQPLLDGLAYIHSTGYLHRDIKPDNIYVRAEDGSLVLLDFGSARRTTHAAVNADVVYTPGYAPIEQYEGHEQGPWTDVYALGATLYWMVCDQKPIPAPRRASEPMHSAAELGQGRYGVALLRAIDWALSIEPAQRPADIPALCKALFANHPEILHLQEAFLASDAQETRVVSDQKSTGEPSRLARGWKTLREKVLKPGSWPLVSRITAFMVLAAILPMLITAYYNLRDDLARTSKNQLHNMESLAISTAGEVAQLLNDSRNLAAYLGSDNDFIAFLSQPTDAGREEIINKLNGLRQANPDVRSVQVIDAEGLTLASTVPGVIGVNYKFRDYYKVTMEGRVHISSLIVGAVIPEPGMFFSHPIYNPERKIIGLVSMRINGASITRLVDATRDNEGRTAMLVDGDGVLVHHPDTRYRYRAITPLSAEKKVEIEQDQRYGKGGVSDLPMPELAQQVLGAKAPGNMRYRSAISNAEEITGYAPVPGTDWHLLVSEPLSKFEAPLNQLFVNMLYSVALVGLVFILFAMSLSRNLVRPILQLTRASEALKAGNFDQAHVTVTTTDEIGRLARTFNVMCDVLRQREHERERELGRKVEHSQA